MDLHTSMPEPLRPTTDWAWQRYTDCTTLSTRLVDAADAVYNITQGTVRLYKLRPDGRRQIVGFLLPGDFLGLALSDQYPLLGRRG